MSKLTVSNKENRMILKGEKLMQVNVTQLCAS